MTTELFITTPRLGTIAVDGTVNITGTGTYFTADDVGKSIIIRTTAGDKRSVVATYVSATSITVATAIDTTQSGCYFYIDYQTADLYEDFPYSLNYAIADIRNPESRNSSFSKTIKLPGSKANNIIFDNIFEIDLEGSFNPNIRAFIIVYSNYIPVFNGNLQLLRINREQDKIEYEVSIFGKIGDLFQKIADKLLTDLDLSDLDQTGTAAQITGSWAGGADLFYPLLANGRQIFSTATPQYISDQIAPAIKVSRIFEDILSSVGYSCADTATLYAETGMDKLYIPCLKEWRRKCYYAGQIKIDYGAGLDQIFLTLSVDRIRQGITEVIESVFYQKTGGAITTITSFQNHELELDYGDVVYVTIDNVISNGFTVKSGVDTFFTIQTLDNEYNYNSPISFQAGVTTDYTIPTSAFASALITFDNVTTGGNYDLYNFWDETTYKGTAPVKHTQGFLPDNYKQRDFLLALIKMFNLYLEPVFDNDTQINILPRDTYYSQGSAVDWTTKLDVGQTIEFTPMGELDWKEYLFSFKEDADFWNKDYKAKTFENYGQRTVVVENDFIATKKSIIPEVAPFPLRQSAYNSLVLSNCIKDGVSTIPNIYTGILRVIYYDANTTTGATTLDGVAKATYPFSGHLVGTPQVPTLDYNYAAPRSVYYTLNDPTLYPISNNLYTNFWQNFIEEISDKYSKIMTAYFNLTAEDIRTIDFRDSFFVDGTYYRLNKIIDYSPIGNTLTKVELIKIRDAVFIPSDSFSHGNVDLTNVSVGTPPYISTEVLEGQIIAGDAQGLGVAQTLSQDVIIDSSARVTVKGLRGRDIQDVAPANGDVYQWVAANSRWEPTAASGGSGTVTSVNAGTNISVTGTATDPIINSLSDRYKTSSTTSNSVSNGSKSFTVDLNLSYIPLQEILVVYDAANHMHGAVTSYNSATGALVVDIKNHTGSGTYTSWVLNLDGTPVDALSGSGTINEIAYFTGAQTLSSLAVATYPSLTQLAYVKGVTSAIQTQLNTKICVNRTYASSTTRQTGTTTIPMDNTIPQKTEGDEYLTITHTPLNTANRLVITAQFQISPSALSTPIIALFQDTASNALAAAFTSSVPSANYVTQAILRYEMAAGTTSATTFKIRIGMNVAGTLTVNGFSGNSYFGGTMYSHIQVEEFTI